MRVRETIHHGNYYNVREAEIEPTWDGFVRFYMESPYKGASTPEGLVSNRFFAATFVNLFARGRGEMGWAEYEDVSEV